MEILNYTAENFFLPLSVGLILLYVEKSTASNTKNRRCDGGFFMSYGDS